MLILSYSVLTHGGSSLHSAAENDQFSVVYFYILLFHHNKNIKMYMKIYLNEISTNTELNLKILIQLS